MRIALRGVLVVAALVVVSVAVAGVTQGDAAPPRLEVWAAHSGNVWLFSLVSVSAFALLAVVGGVARARRAERMARARAAGQASDDVAADASHERTDFARLIDQEWAGICKGRHDLAEKERAASSKPAPASTRPCPSSVRDIRNAAADEPLVSFRAEDVMGLALSGGGIRSATFNLGLLQGLHERNLLPLVDYLSTVSGGGYIGSMWSEWLVRTNVGGRDGTRLFPSDRGMRAPRERVDTDVLRHLREFGGFLAPRVGFLEVETWTALVAVLAGLVPALALALAFIGVSLLAFLVLTIPLASTRPWAGVATVVVVTLVVVVLFEYLWQTVKRPRNVPRGRAGSGRQIDPWHAGFALAALVLIAALQLALPSLTAALHPIASRPASETAEASAPAAGTDTLLVVTVSPGADEFAAPVASMSRGGVGQERCGQPVESASRVRYVRPCWEAIPAGDWWRLSGIRAHDPAAWLVSPGLFDYALAWLGAGLLLILARLAYPLVPQRRDVAWVGPFDRVLMRVLGLGVFWTVLVLLWHLAINVDRLVLTATAAVASAGLFALLRNWIGVVLSRPKEAGVLDRLKPLLPQIMAYLTLILTFAAVGQGLVTLCGDRWMAWWAAGSAMLGILTVGLFIDLSNFGLHAFYRARICRAYPGACAPAEASSAGPSSPDHRPSAAPRTPADAEFAAEPASANRGAEPRPDDDRDLRTLMGRPLHLICCTANDLTGDPVGTLGRGGRSAVLSRYGLAMGPYAARVESLSLGSAITASAAAFNSNMGDISMEVGPAVSFLMTALNLRLGLWVRHPAAPAAASRLWPGWLLYREMFGMTSASGAIDAATGPSRALRDIHLSDGGHFENLALYELVRRHCRYILVSDCGADQSVAFDDLGRAMRRIREDFGTEISIDVERLRRGPDGRSPQHLAVGRIHYSPTDAGILLYVKPTLTGDEPADILQYQTRNTDFPHEGTGDQFYDESQWESYRRLGMHVAESVFAFVPPTADPASGATPASETTAPASGENQAQRTSPKPTPRRRKVKADWAFASALAKWGPTPPGLEARVLQMTARVNQLEAEFQHALSSRLLSEVFPELTFMPALQDRPPHPASGTPESSDLSALLQMTQMMEDVWLACELDAWWQHPLNMGWVNLFARWTTAPTFRFWWPLIGPMFSQGFRDFVEERFPAPVRAGRNDLGVACEGDVIACSWPPPDGLAKLWWETRVAQPCPWKARSEAQAGETLFQNVLDLPGPAGTPTPMQVGLVRVVRKGTSVAWCSDEFFVPPSLWGAGIGWYFLDNLLNELGKPSGAQPGGIERAFAIVKAPLADASTPVQRDDVRQFVDQYRKIGFNQRLADQALTPALRNLLEDLEFSAATDTLLELDLPTWMRERSRSRSAG